MTACIAMVSSIADVEAKVARKPVQTTVKKAEPAQCQKLRADYDNASKKLALSKAYQMADMNEMIGNSPIRSTMRNSENGNIITQAQMTFDIMKSTGCKLPTYTPSADRYGMASLNCAVALSEQKKNNALASLKYGPQSYDTPTACDISTWPKVED